MKKFKSLINGRVPNKFETKVYEKFDLYDQKKYEIPDRHYDDSTIWENTPIQEKELTITTQEIKEYVEYGREINKIFSYFNPGQFLEKGNYEASFSKKAYYHSELDFVIELFISHNRIHAFYDGNKRTAFRLLVDLLFSIDYLIKDNYYDYISDIQLQFLTNAKTETDLKNIIYQGIVSKKTLN